MHGDLAQRRQARLELVPDPHRQVLAGRVLEARHLVEITVVQCVIEQAPGVLYLGEVDNPTCDRIDRALEAARVRRSRE